MSKSSHEHVYVCQDCGKSEEQVADNYPEESSEPVSPFRDLTEELEYRLRGTFTHYGPDTTTAMLAETAMEFFDERLRAHSALPTSSGNDKLPLPSLPVESLEDVLEAFKLVWDVAAQGPAHQLDDPFKVGDRLYDFQTPPKIALLDYIGRLIEREKQKARIKAVESTVSRIQAQIPLGEAPDAWEEINKIREELREESNT